VAEHVQKSARFKAGDKGFEGAGEQQASERRGRPVEFAPDDEEADPFGLDQFLSEAKKGKALDKIGDGAGMSAAAGGSMGSSGRSSLNFERGSH